MSGRPPSVPGRPLDVTIVEFLPSGGMFQFAFQFAEALARGGHRVRLLTGPDPELSSATEGLSVISLLPTWHPTAADPGGPVRRKLRRAYRALLLAEAWRRVMADLRRHPPDVAQFGELRYMLDTAALLVMARFAKSHIVDVAHNPVPYDVTSSGHSVEKRGRLTRWLLAHAYRACDLLMVLGEGPGAKLRESFPGTGPIAVCGHGDYSALHAPGQSVAPSAAPPHVLLFGAWTRYKNIPLLLEAFALVRERLPEAGLTLAGPVMPDVDLAAIEKRAGQIGGVNLRQGYVAIEDLPNLFGQHRLVVFPYTTVNISGSVHMAYTFGRPVVATGVGSMADVVEDGVNGLIVEPDSEAVADGMLKLLRTPELADRMGAAAAEHARTASSWTDVAERAVAAYREVIPSPQGKAFA
jgi:glycosyltransferase involved in cell wall biosynthesis